MTTAIPFYGFEPFILGRTRDQIKSLAGAPSGIRSEEFSNGDISEIWNYDEIGVELDFSDTYEWRLSSVTIEIPGISVNGAFFVGAATATIEKLAAKAGIKDIEQTDDFEENGLCFGSDTNGLMLWAVDGTVVNATLFPKYDESGNVPLWPE